MKHVVTLFPDELHEVMLKARFNEKRNSMAIFIREAIKTYLINMGYDLPSEFETIKQGPVKGWKKPIEEPLEKAIESYVKPQPSPAWDTKGWNEE